MQIPNLGMTVHIPWVRFRQTLLQRPRRQLTSHRHCVESYVQHFRIHTASPCFTLLANSAGQLYQGSRNIIAMLTPPGTRGRPGRRVFGWSLRTAPTLCSSFDESFKFQTACQSYQRLQKHLEHSLPFWLKIDYAVHLPSSWMISNAF